MTPISPAAQALLEELAGYGYLPQCSNPQTARWTGDPIPCGRCEPCAYLDHAAEIINRHLCAASSRYTPNEQHEGSTAPEQDQDQPQDAPHDPRRTTSAT